MLIVQSGKIGGKKRIVITLSGLISVSRLNTCFETFTGQKERATGTKEYKDGSHRKILTVVWKYCPVVLIIRNMWRVDVLLQERLWIWNETRIGVNYLLQSKINNNSSNRLVWFLFLCEYINSISTESLFTQFGRWQEEFLWYTGLFPLKISGEKDDPCSWHLVLIVCVYWIA